MLIFFLQTLFAAHCLVQQVFPAICHSDGVTALAVLVGGKVIWATGFVMLVGQFLGARMGSRLVLSKGQKLIRPMIVIVSAVMSAKLLYDSHGQEILHWLGMN